jgi:uncharacterized protein YraI
MRFYKLKCAAASVAVAALAAAPIAAKKAESLRDLIGARGAGAETELGQRGFEYISGNKSDTASYTYWWDNSGKDCVRVEVRDGRVAAITDAKAEDCGKKSGSNDAAIAAAAVGAVAIGAILLSRKDKDRHREQYQQDWQQVEVHNTQSGSARIFRNPDKNSRVRDDVREGTILRNFGCDNYNGESWCEVSTLNGRTQGWARDRYLRVRYGNNYPDYGSGGGYPGGGWGGSGGSGNGNYGYLTGSRPERAEDTLRQRGFRMVDNSRSGRTYYSIWYRNGSRECLQMAVADNRVDSVVDIQRHPRCR